MATKRPTRTRRPVHRLAAFRRRPLRWRTRLVVLAIAIFAALFAVGAIARQLAPTSNTEMTRFDAIIVLGYPADSDGNPTPEMLERVTEAVHEYERGVAPRLILSGGRTHHGFVEAEVMARTAQAMGIPTSAIVLEPQAMSTYQNANYSLRLMQAHGWDSAEVVSSASHLPRAAILFNRLPLKWRAHAAVPSQAESPLHWAVFRAAEILKTTRFFLWTQWLPSIGVSSLTPQ